MGDGQRLRNLVGEDSDDSRDTVYDGDFKKATRQARTSFSSSSRKEEE